MTALELKQYIYDNQKIEYVLEDLHCRKINFNSDKSYYSATQPDGDNAHGVIIKCCKELNYYSYSRNIHIEDGLDIYDFIQSVKKIKFSEAIKYLHKLFGLKLTFKYSDGAPAKKKESLEDFFKNLLSKRRRCCNVEDIHFLDDKILEDFFQGLHISWFKEGIMPWTAKKFGLCYSYRRKRQIIPIRYWLDGRLVGTNARTTIENYDLFDIKKYFITKGYNKTSNVYGYWENHEEIEKKGYCVLFEAEKSVLKRDSLNDPTGLALQGHSMSEEQFRIILSLNVRDIIIALDKDVCLDDVWAICDRFYNKRNVYYIYDKHDLLKEKDSPADVSNKVYNYLMKHKVAYNEAKHKQFLKNLKTR